MLTGRQLAFGAAVAGLILLAYLAAPFFPRSAELHDGSPLPLDGLRGWRPLILEATYGAEGQPSADVAAALQAGLDAVDYRRAPAFTLSAAELGLPPGGVFAIKYRACARKTRSVPRAGRRLLPRARPEGFAPRRPSPHGRNPVTGVGDHDFGAEARADTPLFGLESGRPGYMEEVADRAADMLAYTHGRRSPAVAGGAPPCVLAPGDLDSDLISDGHYEAAVAREALTSRREPAPNTLVASRVGFGSVRLDPRFEPGPQSRFVNGDASPSHGGHAGGITLGAFGSSRFIQGGVWDARYVHGRADAGHGGLPEALYTERSRYPM